MKNIFFKISDQQSSDYHYVLATIVRTQGSTPQKPGSSALFGKDGVITGTVGGGIVEGKIQEIATKALLSKVSGLYHFDLSYDISYTEEAICGGQISVLIDARPENFTQVFNEVKESMSKQIPGVLITMVTLLSDEEVQINRYFASDINRPSIPSPFFEKIEPIIMSSISSFKRSAFKEVEILLPGTQAPILFFFEPIYPPDHLVIAGAGHIGRALAHLGSMLNFEVTIVDDRPEYANFENIPDADHLIVKDIGQAMQELRKSRNTYVVIVTRGHNDDAEALKPCIGSGLTYIGMIGSKKKIATMQKSFIDRGWATKEQWEEIHAPVGLDIKSQTVEEIAVSIAAQLVLIRNGRE